MSFYKGPVKLKSKFIIYYSNSREIKNISAEYSLLTRALRMKENVKLNNNKDTIINKSNSNINNNDNYEEYEPISLVDFHENIIQDNLISYAKAHFNIDKIKSFNEFSFIIDFNIDNVSSNITFYTVLKEDYLKWIRMLNIHFYGKDIVNPSIKFDYNAFISNYYDSKKIKKRDKSNENKENKIRSMSKDKKKGNYTVNDKCNDDYSIDKASYDKAFAFSDNTNTVKEDGNSNSYNKNNEDINIINVNLKPSLTNLTFNDDMKDSINISFETITKETHYINDYNKNQFIDNVINSHINIKRNSNYDNEKMKDSIDEDWEDVLLSVNSSRTQPHKLINNFNNLIKNTKYNQKNYADDNNIEVKINDYHQSNLDLNNRDSIVFKKQNINIESNSKPISFNDNAINQIKQQSNFNNIANPNTYTITTYTNNKYNKDGDNDNANKENNNNFQISSSKVLSVQNSRDGVSIKIPMNKTPPKSYNNFRQSVFNDEDFDFDYNPEDIQNNFNIKDFESHNNLVEDILEDTQSTKKMNKFNNITYKHSNNPSSVSNNLLIYNSKKDNYNDNNSDINNLPDDNNNLSSLNKPYVRNKLAKNQMKNIVSNKIDSKLNETNKACDELFKNSTVTETISMKEVYNNKPFSTITHKQNEPYIENKEKIENKEDRYIKQNNKSVIMTKITSSTNIMSNNVINNPPISINNVNENYVSNLITNKQPVKMIEESSILNHIYSKSISKQDNTDNTSSNPNNRTRSNNYNQEKYLHDDEIFNINTNSIRPKSVLNQQPNKENIDVINKVDKEDKELKLNENLGLKGIEMHSIPHNQDIFSKSEAFKRHNEKNCDVKSNYIINKNIKDNSSQKMKKTIPPFNFNSSVLREEEIFSIDKLKLEEERKKEKEEKKKIEEIRRKKENINFDERSNYLIKPMMMEHNQPIGTNYNKTNEYINNKANKDKSDVSYNEIKENTVISIPTVQVRKNNENSNKSTNESGVNDSTSTNNEFTHLPKELQRLLLNKTQAEREEKAKKKKEDKKKEILDEEEAIRNENTKEMENQRKKDANFDQSKKDWNDICENNWEASNNNIYKNVILSKNSEYIKTQETLVSSNIKEKKNELKLIERNPKLDDEHMHIKISGKTEKISIENMVLGKEDMKDKNTIINNETETHNNNITNNNDHSVFTLNNNKNKRFKSINDIAVEKIDYLYNKQLDKNYNDIKLNKNYSNNSFLPNDNISYNNVNDTRSKGFKFQNENSRFDKETLLQSIMNNTTFLNKSKINETVINNNKINNTIIKKYKASEDQINIVNPKTHKIEGYMKENESEWINMRDAYHINIGETFKDENQGITIIKDLEMNLPVGNGIRDLTQLKQSELNDNKSIKTNNTQVHAQNKNINSNSNITGNATSTKINFFSNNASNNNISDNNQNNYISNNEQVENTYQTKVNTIVTERIFTKTKVTMKEIRNNEITSNVLYEKERYQINDDNNNFQELTDLNNIGNKFDKSNQIIDVSSINYSKLDIDDNWENTNMSVDDLSVDFINNLKNK